eukprot:Opistho-1_new@7036
MSVLLIVSLMLQAGGSEDPALQAYREKTRAIIPCKTTGDPDEVTICALREADKKYRVPFVSIRAADNVPAQTERVLEDVMFQCGVSGPFLTQCGGMVGVTVGVGFDGKVMRKREPAP